MTYVDEKAQRVSSESAYLTDDVLARPNLKVVINAKVTKIILESLGDQQPRAVGVEFTLGPNQPVYCSRARKEVIVA